MKYHNILHDNMANGEGLRVVLFVSGCNHYCKGCQNPVTWDIENGLEFTAKELTEICEQLSKDYISGITLSGGDPLHPEHRDGMKLLCHYLKMRFPNKTIWCYTGYV